MFTQFFRGVGVIDKMRPFLKDKKDDLPLNNKGNSIKLIMEFFSTDNKAITDLEKLKYNQEMYEKLGWQNENYFDVLSSFWTIFSCAVIREVHNNKEYSRSKRYYIFPDYIDYSTPWIPGGKNGYEKNGERQDSFPERFLKKLPGTISIVNSTINSYQKLNELATLTHSVANFMPCPPPPYNAAKGLIERIHDFIPLFIDLIDAHCEQEKSVTFYESQYRVEVKVETLHSWKKWLISNRGKYCLEDYYYIYTDKNSIEHIKGIPFFKSQSLNNPLPRTDSEIEECLDEMIKRIYVRAFRLSNIF